MKKRTECHWKRNERNYEKAHGWKYFLAMKVNKTIQENVNGSHLQNIVIAHELRNSVGK